MWRALGLTPAEMSGLESERGLLGRPLTAQRNEQSPGNTYAEIKNFAPQRPGARQEVGPARPLPEPEDSRPLEQPIGAPRGAEHVVKPPLLWGGRARTCDKLKLDRTVNFVEAQAI